MRQLYPSELKAIVKELQRQVLIDEYAEHKNKWAFLAAVITNGFSALIKALSGKKGKPKLVEPDDFIGKDFKKIIQQALGEEKNKRKFEKHIQDAKRKGLNGPW